MTNIAMAAMKRAIPAVGPSTPLTPMPNKMATESTIESTIAAVMNTMVGRARRKSPLVLRERSRYVGRRVASVSMASTYSMPLIFTVTAR